MNKTKIKIGFITISDRAARGEYKDIGGPAMQTWIQQAVLSPYKVVPPVVKIRLQFLWSAKSTMVCSIKACSSSIIIDSTL
jgi:molybdopterin biosynthesis enzyme MoaB